LASDLKVDSHSRSSSQHSSCSSPASTQSRSNRVADFLQHQPIRSHYYRDQELFYNQYNKFCGAGRQATGGGYPFNTPGQYSQSHYVEFVAKLMEDASKNHIKNVSDAVRSGFV